MGFNFIFQVSISLICLVILFYVKYKFKAAGRQDKIAKVSCPAVMMLCIFNLIDPITGYKFTLIISAVSLVCLIIGASPFIYEIRNINRKKRNQIIISSDVDYGAESDKTK